MDNLPQRYKETDKMSDLICGNYSLLLVMSRFGLPLGFGDRTVKEICTQNGVDYKTFLAVVNIIEEDHFRLEDDSEGLSVASLMSYLKQAHSYFLDFNLPVIRRKLIEAIDCSTENEVAFLILKFFDEYVGEVRKHMDYENKMVFKYVEDLLQGKLSDSYQISIFARRHNQIEAKLTELKNIIIKYYPAKANNNLLNAVLFDIYSCEQDLATHCKVEDYMFVPAVRRMEKEVGSHEK